MHEMAIDGSRQTWEARAYHHGLADIVATLAVLLPRLET